MGSIRDIDPCTRKVELFKTLTQFLQVWGGPAHVRRDRQYKNHRRVPYRKKQPDLNNETNSKVPGCPYYEMHHGISLLSSMKDGLSN